VRTQGSLSHYTYWYDHPPFGWLQLAGLQAVLGPVVPGTSVSEARLLLVPYAVASCLLVALMARRLGLTRTTAVGAALLLVLSPLALASLRGVYLDVLGLPWLLLAFVLVLTPGRRLWAHAGAGLAFAAAVLSKETFLLALPGLLLAARQGTTARTRAFCTAGLLSVLALVVLAYPLLACSRASCCPARTPSASGTPSCSSSSAVRDRLGARPDDGERWARRQLAGAGPVAAGYGRAAGAVRSGVPRLRVPAATLLVLVLAGLRPGYLPQPYVVALLPFAALVVAGCAELLVQASRRSALWALLAGAVAAAAAVVVAPSWAAGLREAHTVDTTATQRQALAAVVRDVPRSDRVLIDDTYYVDLVEAGFQPRYGAVWFYKMDLEAGLDPSVVRRLPTGVAGPGLGGLQPCPAQRPRAAGPGRPAAGAARPGEQPGRPDLRRG
jgi:hypothetical protein